MLLCFLCGDELNSECTQVCSSTTPHSKTPFAVKISEMLGEGYVVAVSPADQMCMKCTLLLNDLDYYHNELEFLENRMISQMQNSGRILPLDQVIEDVEADQEVGQDEQE